jgi:hypothetical protein
MYGTFMWCSHFSANMVYQYVWGFHQQKSEKKKSTKNKAVKARFYRALETKPSAVQRVFAKGARAAKTSQGDEEGEKVGS